MSGIISWVDRCAIPESPGDKPTDRSHWIVDPILSSSFGGIQGRGPTGLFALVDVIINWSKILGSSSYTTGLVPALLTITIPTAVYELSDEVPFGTYLTGHIPPLFLTRMVSASLEKYPVA